MSASLVGSEMCIRDSRRTCTTILRTSGSTSPRRTATLPACGAQASVGTEHSTSRAHRRRHKRGSVGRLLRVHSYG
eukprot:13709170-Alexandrium_andersonii.AAC.1